MKKILTLVSLSIFVTALLVGCGSGDSSGANVVSQPPPADGKIDAASPSGGAGGPGAAAASGPGALPPPPMPGESK